MMKQVPPTPSDPYGVPQIGMTDLTPYTSSLKLMYLH